MLRRLISPSPVKSTDSSAPRSKAVPFTFLSVKVESRRMEGRERGPLPFRRSFTARSLEPQRHQGHQERTHLLSQRWASVFLRVLFAFAVQSVSFFLVAFIGPQDVRHQAVPHHVLGAE